MVTITIDKSVNLEKTNFININELYLALQEKIAFENELQTQAERAMNINESELIDF